MISNITNRDKVKTAMLSLLIATMILAESCKKFAEVGSPDTSINTENAFKDGSTASAVFIGLYSRLSQQFNNGGLSSSSIVTELSADNLSLYDLNANRTFMRYYKNDLEPRYLDEGTTYWQTNYQLLYTINDAISRLDGNTYLEPILVRRLQGEAYFLRAFIYFYLVNFYGEVPLILTTDPQASSKAIRRPVAEVYAQMLADLLKAEGLLDTEYVGPDAVQRSAERLRPNKSAVNALQARIYLYQGNYAAAIQASTKVLENLDFELVQPAESFIKNSRETIWALQPVTYGVNTFASRFLLLPAGGPDGAEYNFYLSASLWRNFEPGDQRKANWLDSVEKGGIKYHYPTKYKARPVPGSSQLLEYEIVLRLAEQYLIRAEARNESGDAAGAAADLNTLREKRRAAQTIEIPDPLPQIVSSASTAEMKIIIARERRSELFTEWGHRWFDLKRSGTIDQVMTAEQTAKGANWESHKALFPVPTKEIQFNRALSQNPGYIN